MDLQDFCLQYAVINIFIIAAKSKSKVQNHRNSEIVTVYLGKIKLSTQAVTQKVIIHQIIIQSCQCHLHLKPCRLTLSPWRPPSCPEQINRQQLSIQPIKMDLRCEIWFCSCEQNRSPICRWQFAWHTLYWWHSLFCK